MAGSTRFELTSGSPEGSAFAATYPNGQRGNYSAANLDRSRSFREGMENRMLSSGPGSSRGSNTLSASMPPLSQCLVLEPLSDPKFPRAGELRRVLNVNFGNASEDHSVGAAHSKAPPVAIDELKRVKTSIYDACSKARERAKTLNESIIKLDKYCEALESRKKQRSELLSSERSGGTNLLKMGGQIHQNRPGLVTQRLEERTKNAVPNKRVRTSVAVAEVRAEGRNSTLSRQPGLIEKDRDALRAGNGGSVEVEEKVRGLPAGGEGWDKKMKRKRSVGTVVTRGMDGEREVKRAMHQKFNCDPRSRSCDAHGFRSGPSNGITGINKLDGASQPTTSNARVIPRNDLESVSLPRDRAAGLEKERIVAKANNKLNIREDSQSGSPSAVTKGKASRAPRTGSSSGSGAGGSGSGVATTSSPNFHRPSGVLDACEQPPSLNKVQSVGGTNNRKRPLPTGSSSPPMAQWVGQRQISRTRRTNLVAPVSNTDEAQISSEGFPPSDIGGRLNSNESNGSLLARGTSNNTQQSKMKLESVPSPARLSESEESGAGENKFKEKGMENVDLEDRGINAVQKVGSFSLPTKKNKMFMKEEFGDGVRRQGRSGRSSSLSRVCVPPVREKSENTATTKPLRSTRPGSDKNESRSGRPPSKKLSERKAFARPGHVLNSGSSDFMGGESDDDHEELLTAANSAQSASYHACNGSFWKKMEPIFASVSSEDAAFLKKQINFAEELDESLRHMFGADSNILGELLSKEISLSQTLASGDKQRSHQNGIGSNESDQAAGLVDQSQSIGTLCGRIDVEGQFDKVAPLYQRVLSALIGEDVVEEFDRNSERSNVSFQYANEDSPSGTCNHVDIESKDGERMESDIESELDPRIQKRSFDLYSCNGSTASNSFRSTSICKPSYNELWQAEDGLMHSEVGVVSRLTETNLEGPQDIQTNISGISSIDCEYQQMSLDVKLLLELQSIGLYPETVPDLAEGEEEISKDIVELKKGLYQQGGRKKDFLFEIDKAVQKGREMEVRDLEQVAMNKLVEMAYKKQMACRGNHASKSGVNKVSRQVAMAFVKRTLARCQKFEDTGISCFSDPALRVVLFSSNDAKTDCVGGAATSMCAAGNSFQPEARASAAGAFSSTGERNGPHNDKLDRGSSGAVQPFALSSDQGIAKHEPLLNRGKKKEVLLDDVVGSAASRATSALGNTVLGGAKGKRSERERDPNKDTLSRNSVAKAGRPSLGNFRGERKTKTKPKQKTAQLSTSGNGLLGRLAETTHPVYTSGRGSSETVTHGSVKVSGEMGLVSHGNVRQNLSKETEEPIDFANLQLHELDPIEGLGVSNDIGGNPDLSSWLNFDEDGLQDHDSMGLEIPMDDLSDLNMLI